MTLIDRVLDRLEEVCRQEDTQRRLRKTLLDPAADYLARKLYKVTVVVGCLLLLQTCFVLLLVHQLTRKAPAIG